MAKLDDATTAVPSQEIRSAVVLGDPLPRRYVILAVVAIALFMAAVDQTIVATALSSVQRELGASVNWSTWTITVYALGQILAMPLAGRLSDQYGRKNLFLGAVVIFTVSSLLCGLSTNIYELVALRALQALGGGAFLPSATGIVSDYFGRDRDRAIGLFTSIFPIGGLVGPILGGVFVTYWSWRGIFLINVPLGVALLALGWWLLPRAARTEHAPVDFRGIALLVAGLLGLMLAVSMLGSSNSGPLAVVVPLLVGAGATVLFVRHSARIATPFIPIRLLRGRAYAVGNVINVLSGAATLGLGALVPLYAVDRYHLSVLTAGSLLTARAVGTILIATTAALAIRRTGYRWPMRIGFLLTAAGMLAIAMAPRGGLSPEVWLTLACAVSGLGMGISIPANNNAALELDPSSAAAISGLRAMSRQIGGITAISIIAALSARAADVGAVQSAAFLALAVLLLAVIPLVNLVPERRGAW